MAYPGAPRLVAVVASACIASLALAPLGARAVDPESIAIDRMRLATDGSGILSVEGGAVLPHLATMGAAWLGYVDDPLVVHRLADGQRVASLVDHRTAGALSAAIGVLDRGQLALIVPVVFDQARSSSVSALVSAPRLDAFGVGSLGIVPKVRLLDAPRHGIDLAVLAGATVPLGASGFIGSEATFHPELAASRAFGALRVAANAGATFRRGTPLLDAKLGSELDGQLGVALGLGSLLRVPVEAGAVLASGISAARPFARSDETSVELRGFAAYDPFSTLRILAGAGFGVESGWGTPDWRVFAGVQFALPHRAAPATALAEAPARAPAPPTPSPPPAPPDTDGDGIVDPQDRCPLEPGPAENQGCPDRDRDGDGVVDRLDECPDVPGPADRRGCPPKTAARLAGDRIELGDNVYFATARHLIEKRSYPLLDNVAKVILAHPEIGRIRVEGHTDARGGAEYNRALSQRRAAAVVAALVARGVRPDRLVAQGFGLERPVADNKTASGRAKNRRVELRVVDAVPASTTAK